MVGIHSSWDHWYLLHTDTKKKRGWSSYYAYARIRNLHHASSQPRGQGLPAAIYAANKVRGPRVGANLSRMAARFETCVCLKVRWEGLHPLGSDAKPLPASVYRAFEPHGGIGGNLEAGLGR